MKKVKTFKKSLGILLSFLMIMQMMAVPSFAVQKLNTPTGFEVSYSDELGEDILAFTPSTPSQYVEGYKVSIYVLSDGVIYDPGMMSTSEEPYVYMFDVLDSYQGALEELGNNFANPKLVMTAQAISNSLECEDSEPSIYFDQQGNSAESQISYVAGGFLTDTATWKMTKENELYVCGTGFVDLNWIPEYAEKIIFEEGITGCDVWMSSFPYLKEVYIYNGNFDLTETDLYTNQNSIVYAPKNSAVYNSLIAADGMISENWDPLFMDIAESDTYFRYVVDEKYVDAAKLVSDLKILKLVYALHDENVTKSQLAIAFARLEERGLSIDNTVDKYEDLEVNTFENGAAIKYEDVLLPESETVYGKDIEITYQNVLDIVADRFPNKSVSIDGKATTDNVTYEELAYLLNQLLTAQYLTAGRESTIYVFEGSISDIHLDPEYDQYYATLNGEYQGEFTIEDEEIVEDLFVLVLDDELMTLTSDDDITLYVAYEEVRTGVLSTYDFESPSEGYSASFTINNGEEETSSKNVTLQLTAEGYTKYKIGNGTYKNITNTVSHTLDSTHGIQNVSVTFANADETKTKTITKSIKLNNLHTISYIVNGSVWKTAEVGCGLSIPALSETPEVTGKVFDSWLNMPDVMPDNNISVTAYFTDIPPLGSGECGDNAKWVLLQDGTLSITGTGSIDSYPAYSERDYRSLIKKVVIAEGITQIGDYALYELENLEEIEIPSTVTSLGEGFAKGSFKIKKVEIPATVQSIKMNMSFVKCTELEEIVFLGKDTVLDDEEATELISNVNIYGYSSSDAKRFATENNCPFQEIDPDFVINDRAQETDNNVVTLKFNDYAASFKQFKINGGQWQNMAQTATFTLDKNDGEKTISVIFKNGNLEIEKTHSIIFNNKHNIIYKVNGEEYKKVVAGCGAQISAIDESPVVEGYSFIAWDTLPETMPDNDIICNAILAELPESEALQSLLTEEEINSGYSVSPQIATTTASVALQQAIDTNAEYTPAMIVEITLEKVKQGEENVGISETSDLVAFSFDIPADIQGNFSYIVLREHGESIDTLTTTPNANGEYITVSANKLTIYANRFSAYTLLAKEVIRRSSSGGGSTRYTVKFETNGGSGVKSSSVVKNATVKEPAAPVKDGFTFGGWYSDKELTNKFDFNSSITKSITLYAKWNEAKKVEIIITIGEKEALINGVAKANDVEPVIVNSHTMLPIRFIAEELGAKVDWKQETQTVSVETDAIKISLVIGEGFATVNGEKIALDTPSFIKDSRTFLPLRFVMENLGADVKWDENTRQVKITK